MKSLGLIEAPNDLVTKKYIEDALKNFLKLESITFQNKSGEKCMGVFKVVDGNPLIELIKVGE